jgi:hypothetical protein
MTYFVTASVIAECLHALPQGSAALYGMIGSLAALLVLQAIPTATSVLRDKTELEVTVARATAICVLVFAFAATGIVAGLFADPASPKDGIAWGVGADGLILGLARTRDDQSEQKKQ